MIAELPVAPDAATVISRVRACSMRVTGLSFRVTQIFSSLPIEPIQLNLRPSNRAAVSPNNGAMAAPLVSAAKVSPSGAVELYRVLAAISPPAPGTFFGTTEGLPGIYFGR